MPLNSYCSKLSKHKRQGLQQTKMIPKFSNAGRKTAEIEAPAGTRAVPKGFLYSFSFFLNFQALFPPPVLR
jgi:hypothetical protein